MCFRESVIRLNAEEEEVGDTALMALICQSIPREEKLDIVTDGNHPLDDMFDAIELDCLRVEIF